MEIGDFLVRLGPGGNSQCALVSGAQPPSIGRVSRAAALSGPQYGLESAERYIPLTVRAPGDLVDGEWDIQGTEREYSFPQYGFTRSW